jgi:hypothetical protein
VTTTPVASCRACIVANDKAPQKNDEVYVFCLAECLTRSLKDVLENLCMLHRVKLGVMKVVAERSKGNPQ